MKSRAITEDAAKKKREALALAHDACFWLSSGISLRAAIVGSHGPSC